MSNIKVGVIGTGHLGRIHTKLWSENEKATLIGIFDPDTERAAEIANEFNCETLNSIDELTDKCDAVTIAAPTIHHFDIAKHCVEKNVHCLIEKPITQTHEQGLELIKLAKETGVVIQVGHVERFNPAIAAIKQYEPQPKFIEAHRLAQFKPRATDVSVIHDLMIHDIDILLWLINSPVSKIDANGVAILTDTIDIANARISFENGAVANVTASRISAKPMRKMRIFQKAAYISIDFGAPDVEVFRILESGEKSEGIPATMLGLLEEGLKNKDIYYEKPEIPKLNAIAEEQNSFLKTIKGEMKVPVGAEEATEALRIAEEINKLIEK